MKFAPSFIQTGPKLNRVHLHQNTIPNSGYILVRLRDRETLIGSEGA